MKILVAGGFHPDNKFGEAEDMCARALGRAIANGHHILVTGCYNKFDCAVAEGVDTVNKQRAAQGEPSSSISSYVSPGIPPSHRFGSMKRLNVNSWDPGQPEWGIPEPLTECEALVVLGGGPASHRVVHLTRLAGKPILPLAMFGGAGSEAYKTECERFASVYGGRLTKDEYGVLNTAIEALDDSTAFDRLATAVVSLAAKVTLGNDAFVIMSFNEDLDDTFNTIDRVCARFGFEAQRTDKAATSDRIYRRIIDGIHQAAFVIADVSVNSVNVYYELGFAEALGKEVVVIAKQGAELPFDTNDIPTIFYKNQTRLDEMLTQRIQRSTGRTAKKSR